MPITDANDGRTADDYPFEASPSTDTYAGAELNHAPDAHQADEYHRPPADRDLDALDTGVSRTVIRPATRDAGRREVAL